MIDARAYVFDAYGTLFDVHAAIGRHRAAAGPDADRFSEIWRSKQLEYTWTLTLVGCYIDFWTLTERALDYAFARMPSVDRALRPSRTVKGVGFLGGPGRREATHGGHLSGCPSGERGGSAAECTTGHARDGAGPSTGRLSFSRSNSPPRPRGPSSLHRLTIFSSDRRESGHS
jgi:hypothetical protein